jgi:putative hydroxymethylpyrimidine transport system substrate-binding protein
MWSRPHPRLKEASVGTDDSVAPRHTRRSGRTGWCDPGSRPARHTHLVLLPLITLLVVLTGCTNAIGGDDPDEVSMALDWYPWANHSPFFLADERGYFADEDLDVDIHVPANPEDVLMLVGSGRDTFGISYQTAVLQARQEDIPVQSVAALVQYPLNSIMTLEGSELTRPGDLEGRQIGYPGIPSNEALLETMLESDGLSLDDVELVNVGFNLVQALISEQVDAIIGAYWVHESILAENEGFPVNIMRVEDWGVPIYYELVLVASDETVEENPELVERFVRAMRKGYAEAMDDHDSATDAMIEEYPDTDRALEADSIVLLSPLWTEGADYFGQQTEERWQVYADWMIARGLLDPDADVEEAFTNEFVESDEEDDDEDNDE